MRAQANNIFMVGRLIGRSVVAQFDRVKMATNRIQCNETFNDFLRHFFAVFLRKHSRSRQYGIIAHRTIDQSEWPNVLLLDDSDLESSTFSHLEVVHTPQHYFSFGRTQIPFGFVQLFGFAISSQRVGSRICICYSFRCILILISWMQSGFSTLRTETTLFWMVAKMHSIVSKWFSEKWLIDAVLKAIAFAADGFVLGRTFLTGFRFCLTVGSSFQFHKNATKYSTTPVAFTNNANSATSLIIRIVCYRPD